MALDSQECQNSLCAPRRKRTLPSRRSRRSGRAPVTLWPRCSTRGVTAAPPSPRQQPRKHPASQTYVGV
jgi:hypothetical protein